MPIYLEVENLEKLQAKFAQSPVIVGEELEHAVKTAGIGIIKEEVKQAPHDSGRLQQSIKMEYEPIGITITPDVEYAKYIVSGTAPHWPPLHALDGWARRHGINPVVVQRSIAKKGTKANPFVRRTVENITDLVNDLFKKALENIIARL